MPISLELHKGSPLPADLVLPWVSLQQSFVQWQHPFLRPEFTAAVAAVRSDVEVAILHDGGRAVGFFPFTPPVSTWGGPSARDCPISTRSWFRPSWSGILCRSCGAQARGT